MREVAARHREILEMLREEIAAGYGQDLVSLAVFGSVARGTSTPESDIDLLIVARGLPRGRMERARAFAALEEGMLARHPELSAATLSPVFKTPEELALGSPLLWDMIDDVIVLVDRGTVLRDSLERVRRRLRELGAHKVMRGDAWYWVLKGDYTPGEIFEL